MPDAEPSAESPLTPGEREHLAQFERRLLVFFRPAVLAQYRAEPHRYEVHASDFDGEIGMTQEYLEELYGRGERDQGLSVRFGYRKLRSGEYAIASLIHDFRQYSQSHVERWLPHQVATDLLAPLPDLRFELWAARNLFGSWEVENSLLDRTAETIRLVNAATEEVLGDRLFEHDESPHVAAPVSESDHAYQDAHRELYAYLLDGLHKHAILKLFDRTGAARPKGENGTRKLLQAALPSMVASPLWTVLARVSGERGKATHQVRPRSRAFDAFDAFARDLGQIHKGMKDLLAAIEMALGIDAERAKARLEAERYLPKIDRPMENVHGVDDLDHIVGRTVARVEKGLHARDEGMHGTDVVLIHFEDGSIIGLMVHSNARNVSSDYGNFPASEFNTNFFAQFVPPPQFGRQGDRQ